jgi:hypothetical protein
MQQWELLPEDLLTTVQMDGWVLVMRGPQRENAAQIAEAVSWATEPSTGWLSLGSNDAAVSGPLLATTLILGTGSYEDLTRIELAAGGACGRGSANEPRSTDGWTAHWCDGDTATEVTLTVPPNGSLSVEEVASSIEVTD